ncbi:MAG: pyruvate kinase [Chthonomonadales bacterium]
MRRTKIICTIGPASSSITGLKGLLSAGMDVARLNFSHGTHDDHGLVIDRLRMLAARQHRPLAILQDLSGPKVRLGIIASGTVTLTRGSRITFTTRPVPGDQNEINLPVPELVHAVSPGDRLAADDGKVLLRVVSTTGTDIVVQAVSSGVLSSKKGITAPGINLNIAAITPKDIADLRFGLERGVDWVAASYVRGPGDILPILETMRKMSVRVPIIAKIEKMEAVNSLPEILQVVDGIMVARGDLGVEVPIEEVPALQKRIIRMANEAGKPVITATQMLESMIVNPGPTRAEVTDVANAIIDGTDAVMLSGETAAGAYPSAAVRIMSKVAVQAEQLLPDWRPGSLNSKKSSSTTLSVAAATVEMACTLRAKAIVCATTSGSTARAIARFRPIVRIIGATSEENTYRNLNVSWGVQPMLIRNVTDTDGMMEETIQAAVARGYLKHGDRIILTAGVPVNVIGNTNLIRVHRVGDPIRPVV